MRTLRHVCIDIRGVLNWKDKDLKKLFIDSETGKQAQAHEIRNFLYDKLQEGYEVLPIGDECEGFDKIKGCPGHEIKRKFK